MLNMDFINRTALFQLPPEAEWHNLISQFYARYNHIHELVMAEFGPNGFIVLFLFFLFLLIIIVIYIKSLIDTFSAGRAEMEDADAEPDGLFYTVEEPELTLANDNNADFIQVFDSEELEKLKEEQELSARLIMASQQTADYLHLEEDYLELKRKMQKHAQESQRRRKMLEEEQIAAIKKPRGNKKNIDVEPEIKEEIDDTPDNPVAVVLGMLGHGVTEQKIAQALYYHNKAKMSEEDIIQVVSSINKFIDLCKSGKFNLPPQKQPLPTPVAAMIDLSNGDSSSCLILLQSLLNSQMQKAEGESGIIRDLTYAMAANIACLMGNIAKLGDLELAHNSFELATELSPKNVTAWSRLGDIYMLEDTKSKAMIAYQTVLDIGDRILYSEQIANAQQKLSEYYLAQGLETKAKEMKEESARFYETYGIATPLSNSELKVYQTLKKENAQTLPAVISALISDHR